jgi:phage I-like protein
MSNRLIAYSVLSEQLSTSSKSMFRILPAGRFKAEDGRPGNGSWILTQEIGDAIVFAAKASVAEYPIDYEHQSLETSKNGLPAPAAGWFKNLEWRDDGLHVTDARWTDRAKDMIDRGEYRYISPVFTYDAKSLVVKALHSLALTNKPALPNLTDLASLREDELASGSINDFGSERSRDAMSQFLLHVANMR